MATKGIKKFISLYLRQRFTTNDVPENECDSEAEFIIRYLHSQGVVIKADRELPDSVYDSLIFPTTIEEVGKFLTDKGLTDREKSAISGTIARLGWENAIKAIEDAGYVAVEPLI